jgi:hypothetical protein
LNRHRAAPPAPYGSTRAGSLDGAADAGWAPFPLSRSARMSRSS